MTMFVGRTCLGCVYRSFRNHAEIISLQIFTCNIHTFECHYVPSMLRADRVRDAAGLSLLLMSYVNLHQLRICYEHNHVLSSDVLSKINYHFNLVKPNLLQVPDQNNP